MAVVASLVAATYAPQTPTIPLVVLAAGTLINVQLVRAAWPAGLCAKAKITWSDGFHAEGWCYGGPDVAINFQARKSAGVTAGTLVVDILQTCNTPVLVDVT